MTKLMHKSIKPVRSIIVTKNENKYKILVCFIQRGINFSSSTLANSEAQKIAVQEHINNVMLYQE